MSWGSSDEMMMNITLIFTKFDEICAPEGRGKFWVFWIMFLVNFVKVWRHIRGRVGSLSRKWRKYDERGWGRVGSLKILEIDIT